MTRRPDGALEHDVLAVLWAADAPLLPGDVKDRLQIPLAYTSVATVLGRLHAKGLLTRTESGRAFAYQAAVTEAQLAASRISDVLSTVADREAVFAGFVRGLSKKDAKSLRALLDGPRS